MKRPLFFSNFQKKILQSYLVIIIGGLVLFYVLVAVMVRESSLKTAERSQVSMCIKVSQQLESFMVEMRNVGFQVMLNSRLINDFGVFSQDGDMDNYYSENIVDHINAVSALADINGIQRTATRISVFNRYGDYVSSGVMPQSKEFVSQVMEQGRDIGGIIAELVEDEEHIYVEPPHPDYWNSLIGYEMISLYCPLGNRLQDDMYGIIEIQQDFQKLEEMLLAGLDEDMAVLLFDARGNCIFNSGEDICRPEDYGFYYRQTEGEAGRRYEFKQVKLESGARQYITAGFSETSGWTVAMVRNKDSIVNVIQDIQKIIIVAILAFLALSAYMAYRISLKMTRPINDMIVSAQSISWSNLNMKELEGNDENEIMALNNTFKATLSRLSKSMQLELNARLNALQSQMNPHFLYNTLAVISALAEEPQKVERMCGMLSEMLRYSTVYEEESTSTLADEVHHTVNYLELMKNRYEENLVFSIYTEGDLDCVKVPRVILQPIVENCFKHGFGENGFPWAIDVAVRVTDERWIISVKNNGRPFQEQDLRELNEKVEGFLNGEQKKVSGIGLTNTIIRLRLLYEEQVEYKIYTGNDGCTYVVLKGKYK